MSYKSSKEPILANSGLNINAAPFYLPGHKEKIAKMKLTQLEENKYYDTIENIWWEKNKKMFED